MATLSGLFGLLKKLAIIILIITIAIPLRYGSTNSQYLALRLLHSVLSFKHSIISDPARPVLSAEYRAFEQILRMKPLIKIDPSEDPLIFVKQTRASLSTSAIHTKPSQCSIIKEVFEHDGHTVDTYWINNHQRNFQRHADHFMIYLHGGGYIAGNIDFYTGMECHFSQLFNITILHVEYRLCPEYQLPAPVEDTIAIYRALLRHNISPSQLIFMGDSAGGGLVLLTIQSLINHQLPVPRGAIVLSPWTDISGSGESHQRNRHVDVMGGANNTKLMLPLLLGPKYAELSADSPDFSPLFGSFQGFPPMYINVGTAESLEDDARRVYIKAQEAGVDVTFEEGLHLMHVYPVFFPFYPEATYTLNNIKEWIEKLFA